MAKFYSIMDETLREELLRMESVPFANRKDGAETIGEVENLLVRQEYEEAERLLIKMIESNNEDLWFGAYLFLGQLYEDIDRPLLAVEAYEKAMRLKPNDAMVFQLIADIWEEHGKQELAEAAYRRAVDQLRNGEQDSFAVGMVASHWANLLRSQGRQDEAEEWIDDMLRIYPSHYVLLELKKG